MNLELLKEEVQGFIRSYHGDIAALALKGSPFDHITVQELIQQIDGFRRTQKKLPTWHHTFQIYYPPKINVEQTSSEITAQYKASLVMGKSLADLTGGFGVDSFYFSKRFETVLHFELNKLLSNITNYNLGILQAEHIECIAKDGLKTIENRKFDVIYVDPARRNAEKGKVFFLKDCEPNVPLHLNYLMERSKTLLLKTSPMLDISVGLSELQYVTEIHVVAVENEVKELLWILKEATVQPVIIKTINFSKNGIQTFSFDANAESNPVVSLPKDYLYEPNAAIMKSGGFGHISEKYELSKLHTNSHLYTNNHPIEFPGRIFKVEKVIPYNKKELRNHLLGTKANITTRNFPGSVNELRKKWKIKDGGDNYLFFTTNLNDEKIVLVCSKLN